MAIVLTAFVFAQAIRGMLAGSGKSGWLISPSNVFHGWPMIAANVFIYAYWCWLGFWFIRGTVGRERVFMVGWCADILLWPLRMLWPQWAATFRLVGAFGLALALLAALALLLDRSRAADANSKTEAS